MDTKMVSYILQWLSYITSGMLDKAQKMKYLEEMVASIPGDGDGFPTEDVLGSIDEALLRRIEKVWKSKEVK